MRYSEHTRRPTIIIPAYQPSEILVNLVTSLSASIDCRDIIVINDGSSAACDYVFTQIKSLNITVIEHEKNQGKGAALKSAFKYWLKEEFYQHSPGVITADADGQHGVEDILKMSAQLMLAPENLHVGCREFSQKNVPWRSRFGNQLTRWICNKLLNIQVSDTQSGLRAIPRQLVSFMLAIKTQRYEFELEMLLVAKKNLIPITSVPIQTIYINRNIASHFNPIVDSIKIYFVFIRFACISMMSGLIDMLIFFLMFFATKQILLSMVIGRIVSGTFNFSMNKHFAFKNNSKIVPVFLKYVSLSVCLMFASYLLIKLLFAMNYSIYFSKIFAEISLYIFSFIAQRTIVFKKHGIRHE